MGWTKQFFEVDLSRVKNPEIDPNWQSTKGGSYSRAQIEQWTRELGQIQKEAQIRGLGYQDFVNMRNSPNPRERSLGETHHKFYDHSGKSHVTMFWNGDQYEVNNNGNHRVFAAKSQGLRYMPSEVSVEDRHMDAQQLPGRQSALLAPIDRQPGRSGSPTIPQSRSEMQNTGKQLWERSQAASPERKGRVDR